MPSDQCFNALLNQHSTEQYKKRSSLLNVDKLYETETAHVSYFHLPLFLQEKEELRIKFTGGWQSRYFSQSTNLSGIKSYWKICFFSLEGQRDKSMFLVNIPTPNY